MRTLVETIDPNVEDSRRRLCDLQAHQIRSFLESQNRFESEFQTTLTIARRRNYWNALDSNTTKLLQNMAQWMSIPGSSMHVIKVGHHGFKKAKDLAILATNILIAHSQKVLWYLSDTHPLPQSIASIARAILIQASQQDHRVYSDVQAGINVGDFETEHSEGEWLHLLIRILNRSGQGMFIVVETASPDPKITAFLQTLTTSTSASGVKILLVLSTQLQIEASTEPNRITSEIEPLPPALERRRRPAIHRQLRTPMDTLQQILVARPG